MTQRNSLIRQGLVGAVAGAALLAANMVAFAQTEPQPTTGPAATPQVSPAGVPLSRVVSRLSETTGLLVVADSTAAYERVPSGLLTAGIAGAVPAQIATTVAPDAESKIEAQLDAMVRSLPRGTNWVKLYLPAPTTGKIWRGDEVAALAYAQARLFGPVGAKPPAGQVEIMGRLMDASKAQGFITGLGLKPVYLLTNTRNRVSATGAEPWSPLSQNQWAGMSKDERKAYGEQQAQQIMALPAEERAAIIKQMQQHDTFFDSVKDPLEKMLGHDI